MPPIIQIRDLRKQYNPPDGPVAVKDVDLEIEEGEVFSLLGPNGAGKTTTISIISGLLAPSGGAATVAGHDIIKDPMGVKSAIGVVPQEIALYPTLTARQNLRFFGQLYGLGGKELKSAIDEVLEFIDLTDRANEKLETYSGGMKRRVNIAVGLLHKPQVVYMDEPTVGIDPQSRRRILDAVVQLKEEYGMTVLYTTHYMEEAQELSDRVGIIDHGEIIALGTTGELIQMVGEEDRLLINVGEQSVSDDLLQRLKQEVEGVTQATYESIGLQAALNSDDETEHVQAMDKRSTGTLTPVRSGQTTDGAISVYAKRGRKALPRTLRIIEEFDIEIQSVEVREPDLEAVFLHLTGRALRE